MSINAGEKAIAKEAQLLGAGMVYHDVSCIANPLSLGELSDKYIITIDTAVDNAFYVHMDNERIVKFSRDKNNLYLYKPTHCFLNQVVKKKGKDKAIGVSNVLTLKEATERFSAREIQDARLARKLYSITGTPSARALKYQIQSNTVKNNHVTSRNVKVADEIFGLQSSLIKGRNKSSVENYLEIPNEIVVRKQDLVLCVDCLHIDSCLFLTSIDKTIKFRTCVPMYDTITNEYKRALQQIIKKYNVAGFRVSKLNADNEFKPLEGEIDLKMNFCNADDHVPEAERNNQSLEDRFRVQFYRLPFQKINDQARDNACRQDVRLAASKRGRVEVLFAPHDHKQAQFGMEA